MLCNVISNNYSIYIDFIAFAVSINILAPIKGPLDLLNNFINKNYDNNRDNLLQFANSWLQKANLTNKAE